MILGQGAAIIQGIIVAARGGTTYISASPKNSSYVSAYFAYLDFKMLFCLTVWDCVDIQYN